MMPGGNTEPTDTTGAPDSTRWHALSADEVAARLDVEPTRGLDRSEIERRRGEVGPNAIASARRRSPVLIFLDQFRSLLTYVLIGAAVLAAVVGDVKDPIVIGGVLLVNAVIGFVQTYRAERSIDALQRMLVIRVRVRRAGLVEEVDSESLVPGDIVQLLAGDRVPADGRLLVTANLAVDESALTGESAPVEKGSDALPDLALPVADRENLAFMNTSVARGRGEMVVTQTGMRTAVGRLAVMLSDVAPHPTPLQRQLDGVGRRLALLAGLASLAVFGLALGAGDDWNDALLTSVALAVAAIPEGLPAVVAVTLAVGAHRMAKQHSIVKRLASVETLGCTTVICTDKTGTLTLNAMTARVVMFAEHLFEVEGNGYEPAGSITDPDGGDVPPLEQALLPVVLCSNSRVVDSAVVGDPTEAALLVLAGKGGVDIEDARRRWPRIAEVPFDARHKLMATFHRPADSADDAVFVAVKGAPESVLPRCHTVASRDGMTPMEGATRSLIESTLDGLARRGLRVIAVASRRLSDPTTAAAFADDVAFDMLEGLTLELLVGILDPPRPEVSEAIRRCRDAGVQVKMITGDHRATASAIAAQVGIDGDVLTGAELDDLSVDGLARRIDATGVFARVAPEHKVQIVSALQHSGQVVAMTGDGVNDAPALKHADIGVAMGITGTDVTKEAAEMVLADDNFATIVGAVRSGRTIYDNILKFVRFQLSTNIGAILTILGARLIGLPTPFTPVQVLWVNLIMDGPPALALGLDPPEADVMERPPRTPGEAVLPRARVARLAMLGLVMAIGTLGVFAWADARYRGNVAVTMAFTTFVLFQVANAFNQRSETVTAFTRRSFRNWRLWTALAIVVALQVAADFGPLASLFDTAPLSVGEWLLCAAVATSVLVAEEIRKALRLGARDAPSPPIVPPIVPTPSRTGRE